MSTTIRDIARAAGVSETTVSLAFRPRSRISDETRRRVLQLARQLQYVPHLAARELRRGAPRTLGVLVNDLTNPFYGLMAREIEAVAQRLDFQVLLAETQFDPHCELTSIERMCQARVRGLLVCFCERTADSFARLAESGLPYLALDTRPEGYAGPYVAHDLAAAGRLAAEHLLAVGCRHPALLIPNQPGGRFSSFTHLHAGFAEALAQRGCPLPPAAVIDAGWAIGDGGEAYTRLRQQYPAADGALCGNDLCALGVMAAADAAGRRVGPDLALIGIDDLPVAALPRIGLSSIRQPNARLAELAAEALIAASESGALPELRTTLAPELIARASSLTFAPRAVTGPGGQSNRKSYRKS